MTKGAEERGTGGGEKGWRGGVKGKVGVFIMLGL